MPPQGPEGTSDLKGTSGPEADIGSPSVSTGAVLFQQDSLKTVSFVSPRPAHRRRAARSPRARRSRAARRPLARRGPTAASCPLRSHTAAAPSALTLEPPTAAPGPPTPARTHPPGIWAWGPAWAPFISASPSSRPLPAGASPPPPHSARPAPTPAAPRVRTALRRRAACWDR